jgi:hypothetical protein
MARRFCIGCAHWSFTKGERGQVYSTMTADSDIPASMACGMGRWADLDLTEIYQSDIEEAMERANDCSDYSERPAP